VLTENEIEQFYSGNHMPGIYREEVLESGTLFHLTPGTAVHHPPLAPHMVTNGNNVSVSVSVWFTLAHELYTSYIGREFTRRITAYAVSDFSHCHLANRGLGTS
jgi:hypothetical protein